MALLRVLGREQGGLLGPARPAVVMPVALVMSDVRAYSSGCSGVVAVYWGLSWWDEPY